MHKRTQHAESGQSMVEFALISPFLLVLIVGLMSFSLLFYSYVTIQNGVREGTGAIVHSPKKLTEDQVKSIVRGYSVVYDSSALEITMTPKASWCTKCPVQVTAFYTVPLPTLGIPTLSGRIEVVRPFRIQATSMMTVE